MPRLWSNRWSRGLREAGASSTPSTWSDDSWRTRSVSSFSSVSPNTKGYPLLPLRPDPWPSWVNQVGDVGYEKGETPVRF